MYGSSLLCRPSFAAIAGSALRGEYQRRLGTKYARQASAWPAELGETGIRDKYVFINMALMRWREKSAIIMSGPRQKFIESKKPIDRARNRKLKASYLLVDVKTQAKFILRLFSILANDRLDAKGSCREITRKYCRV